jgi:hypothetical protein
MGVSLPLYAPTDPRRLFVLCVLAAGEPGGGSVSRRWRMRGSAEQSRAGAGCRVCRRQATVGVDWGNAPPQMIRHAGCVHIHIMSDFCMPFL